MSNQPLDKRLVKDKPHTRVVNIYFPKYDQNFIEVLWRFVETKYPDFSRSEFVVMCIKDYINRLPSDDKKAFEKIANEVAAERPRINQFLERLRLEKKV